MPSPLVEAGIEQQACLGLYRFHEAVKNLKITGGLIKNLNIKYPGKKGEKI